MLTLSPFLVRRLELAVVLAGLGIVRTFALRIHIVTPPIAVQLGVCQQIHSEHYQVMTIIQQPLVA